jgi:hypothetical protein
MTFSYKSVINYISQKGNDSKLLLGIAMILLNFGTKYLTEDISKTNETILKSPIMRRLTIFSMFFMATRDMFFSLGMTAVFIILNFGIFNEKSSVFILPQSFNDDIITDEEYIFAKGIIDKYNKKNNPKS